MDYQKAKAANQAAERRVFDEFVAGNGAITDETLQKDLRHQIEDTSFGQNVLHFGTGGIPVITWIGPQGNERTHDFLSKQKSLYQVHDTLPNHQAYYTKDSDVDVEVAKYRMGRFNGVNMATSIPFLPPARSFTEAQGQALAKALGTNFSMITHSTADLLKKWQQAKGFKSHGNTYYGKYDGDTSENGGTPCYTYPDGKKSSNGLVLLGTCPDSYHIDGTFLTPEGLTGNQWYFIVGRINASGGPMIIPQQDAAFLNFGTAGAGLEGDSSEYKIFLAATGELAARTEAGLILLDFTNGAGNSVSYCLSNEQLYPMENTSQYGSMAFNSFTVRGITRWPMLEQYGIIPGSNVAGTVVGDPAGGNVWDRWYPDTVYCHFDGGSCDFGSNARRRASYGLDGISSSSWLIGGWLEFVNKIAI